MYVGIAPIVMADTVKAFIGIASIVMAYIAMACIVLADVGMAYVVMARTLPGTRLDTCLNAMFKRLVWTPNSSLH